MLHLHNISLQLGQNLLFTQATLNLYSQQRVAIIGANGSGKSSLLGMIQGKYEPSDGTLQISTSNAIASVAQETPASERTALDYVIDGDQSLRKLQQQIKQYEQAEQWLEVAECYTEMEKIDGYSVNARAASIMFGLGFVENEHALTVSSFSGGWRMRLNIAQALMTRSDVLLLDEPTNHLDLDAILWLENYLKKYQGLIIIVSHDTAFIDGIATNILQLEQKQLRLYSGNYSEFVRLRAQEIELQQKAYQKQQQKLQQIDAFVRRFRYKASKAKQVQSRVKALEKMQMVEQIYQKTAFEFYFPEVKEYSGPLINLQDVQVKYADTVILNKINLSVFMYNRIGIIGANGAGKSTLMRLLVGEINPVKGVVNLHQQLKIGYFNQNQVDALDLSSSAIENLQRLDITGTLQAMRNFLGYYGFSGDKIFDKVKLFSGGEKMRLAFALLAWQKPNILLLDEPTNHLDLETKNALMQALQYYKGAIILISHDRNFIDTVVDELWLIRDSRLSVFEGSINDYASS